MVPLKHTSDPPAFQPLALIGKLPLAVLAALLPPAPKLRPILPPVDSESVFKVLPVLALVAAAVEPAELPVAVQLVVLELALVGAHAGLDEDPETLDFVAGPETVVTVSVLPDVFALILSQPPLEVPY